MPSPLPPSLTRILPRCLQQARQPLPQGLVTLCLGAQPIGRLHPMRLAVLRELWPELRQEDDRLVWDAAWQTPEQRGERMGAVAQALRERGAITGWRGEHYLAEAPVDDPCRQRGEPLFRLERAAFRFFGLMSRAVHINGFLPGGRLLCGRRALSKATDPGRLDNLAAGGFSADEAQALGQDLAPAGDPALAACARRELAEEAGVPPALSAALAGRGALRSTRMEPEGLHDEVLHVFSLQLPLGFTPRNADGEVSEFLQLDLESLARRLAASEFSVDAAAVCAWGLQHPQVVADLRA